MKKKRRPRVRVLRVADGEQRGPRITHSWRAHCRGGLAGSAGDDAFVLITPRPREGRMPPVRRSNVRRGRYSAPGRRGALPSELLDAPLREEVRERLQG